MDNHFTDHKGHPAGGISTGIGYTIAWQHGPLGKRGIDIDEDDHPGRNGAFLMEVLESCRSRLVAYQESAFACSENAEALERLNEAMACLEDRRRRRAKDGTLGTHRITGSGGTT